MIKRVYRSFACVNYIYASACFDIIITRKLHTIRLVTCLDIWYLAIYVWLSVLRLIVISRRWKKLNLPLIDTLFRTTSVTQCHLIVLDGKREQIFLSCKNTSVNFIRVSYRDIYKKISSRTIAASSSTLSPFIYAAERKVHT